MRRRLRARAHSLDMMIFCTNYCLVYLAAAAVACRGAHSNEAARARQNARLKCRQRARARLGAACPAQSAK